MFSLEETRWVFKALNWYHGSGNSAATCHGYCRACSRTGQWGTGGLHERKGSQAKKWHPRKITCYLNNINIFCLDEKWDAFGWFVGVPQLFPHLFLDAAKPLDANPTCLMAQGPCQPGTVAKARCLLSIPHPQTATAGSPEKIDPKWKFSTIKKPPICGFKMFATTRGCIWFHFDSGSFQTSQIMDQNNLKGQDRKSVV